MAVIVGLTGGIGSGKTTVANAFAKLGVQYVDADLVARKVVEPGSACLAAIFEHFGESIRTPTGELDRAALRKIIFQEDKEREWLEQLTHPAIREQLKRELAACSGQYCLLVHPLLFEKGHEALCQWTIAISVTPEQQIERVMQRDQNNQQQVKNILATQLSDIERCAKADFIIKNTGTADELNDKVLSLHNMLQLQLV
ncbi:dephospho-CoA kinase [Maribrevibacterium harenarium]|uniref:Dephospho-CoA kinase n=1 Tax=Maribrevibacterium harenarium TaxID=2589817 RepID=A0A501X5C8_9GAMM|nr:dephospho-CoA kinase [Maribrevibacterium harenarium]TPE55607.1 dephospho-CoA kinase [Maribrevibacterium harenarium]